MKPRKTEPVDSAADLIAGECLAARIRLLNRTITAIYDDALRPLGLTVGQLNILVLVAKRSPISPGDLARMLNMQKSTVSRNVGRMRRNEWLTATAAGSGRRQDLVLTRLGKKLLAKSLPAWSEAQAEAGAVLGRNGAGSILQIGNAVLSGLGSD